MPTRTIVFADAGLPVNVGSLPSVHIGPQFAHCAGLTTIEIQGVVPHTNGGVALEHESRLSRVLKSNGESSAVRRLTIAVDATDLSDEYPPEEALFRTIEEELKCADVLPQHITRTWFFIDDITEHYLQFNVTRDIFFDRWGLKKYPASTGIGVRTRHGGSISAIVEAVEDVGTSDPLDFDAPQQCPPANYGSRFTRANLVSVNGVEILNISGISTIDKNGVSIVNLEPNATVALTMRSVADLLNQGNGMRFSDICSAYVYCKTPSIADSFAEYMANNNLEFPHIVTSAEVCRSELLFEIEARAVRPL